MNYIINTTNNETEIIKNNGPFRIERTDNSDYHFDVFQSLIINKPIIIEADDAQDIVIEIGEDYKLKGLDKKENR